MVDKAKSRPAKMDLKQRQHLSERSFARSTRYGFKRARYRSLWCMEIQDFLIAALQNIMVLIEQPKRKMSKSDVIECQKGGHQDRKWTMDRVIKWLMSFYSQLFLSFNPIWNFLNSACIFFWNSFKKNGFRQQPVDYWLKYRGATGFDWNLLMMH